MWPAARFAEVADELAADGAAIILVGTAADPTAAVADATASGVLNVTERTPLPVLGALLSRCSLLVSNDSGVMHLATAVGTPVVAVFGPSNQVAWGPWHPALAADGVDSPHRVVGLELPCRPCLYRGYRLGAPGGCPTRDCLSWLPSDRVVEAARQVLASDG
jgi:heptosyltransferase-2